MKRWCNALTLLVIVTVASFYGCAPKSTHEGVMVMFEGPLSMYDDGVYFNGMSVGSIKSVDANSANITSVIVALNPDFKKQLGDRFVVYLHAGRLEMDALRSYGEPLDAGVPLCGFTSKGAVRWFKFKTLLKDRVAAANKRAQVLYAQFINQ